MPVPTLTTYLRSADFKQGLQVAPRGNLQNLGGLGYIRETKLGGYNVSMKFLRVQQKLISNPIADVRASVFAQLDSLDLKVPRGDVGITAGSRGIANIAAITRACGDWLRDHGARPFLFPAMGS